MIHFLSEYYVCNYKEEMNNEYSGFALGKTTHSSYYYWILKNLGVRDINLCLNINDIHDNDIVFFYCENYENSPPYKFSNLKYLKNVIKIQMMGDVDKIDWADGYLINDMSYINESERMFFIDFPLPSNIKRFDAQYPPRKFGTCCQRWNLNPHFYKKKYINKFKELNIDIIYEHETNYIRDPIDVFFFLRNKKHHLYINHDGSKLHPVKGFKHSNRLYQSFYMNVPALLNIETSLTCIRKSEYDFLEINSVDDFIDKSIFLKNNEDFFHKMILNCKMRSEEHSHLKIKNQFEYILSKLK